MMKRIAFFSAVAALSASTAFAGTKFATNLVPASNIHPPSNPTLGVKSQLKISDKGIIQIGLAGVTDGAGLPASTSTLYNESVKAGGPPDLDGTEYIVIVKLVIPSLSALIPPPPANGEIEVPIPVNTSGGKGKNKFSVTALLANLPAGFGRSAEIVGAEVWGPLGAANEASCEGIVANPLPVNFGEDPPVTACRGGTKIGISGLSIPE